MGAFDLCVDHFGVAGSAVCEFGQKTVYPDRPRADCDAFLASFFAKYVEFDYTASLEEQLDDVAEAKMEWKQVLR